MPSAARRRTRRPAAFAPRCWAASCCPSRSRSPTRRRAAAAPVSWNAVAAAAVTVCPRSTGWSPASTPPAAAAPPPRPTCLAVPGVGQPRVQTAVPDCPINSKPMFPLPPLSNPQCQVWVNHEYRMLYLRHPKAGSTSLLHWFRGCARAAKAGGRSEWRARGGAARCSRRRLLVGRSASAAPHCMLLASAAAERTCALTRCCCSLLPSLPCRRRGLRGAGAPGAHAVRE